MAIVLIPSYYSNFKSNSSQYQVLKRRIDWLTEIDEVTMLVPDLGTDDFYTLTSKCNTVYLDLPSSRYPDIIHHTYIKYLESMDINKTLIVTTQAITAFDLYKALNKPPYRFPKIILDYVENTEDYAVSDPRMLSLFNGYTTLPSIMNSRATDNQMKKKIIKVFNPSYVSKKARPRIANLGVNFEMVNQAKSTEKHKKFTIIYSGSHLMAFKNIETQLKTYDYLYKSGLDFEFRLYLYDGWDYKKGEKLVDSRPYLHLNHALPHTEFIKEASKCHMFFHSSKNETYGFAIWELIEAGVLGFIYDREWIHDMVTMPHNFILKSVTQAQAVLKEIMTYPELYTGLLKQQQEWWSQARQVHTIESAKADYQKAIIDISREFKL
jgi:hypothetical protein